jgi:hypothetical protein
MGQACGTYGRGDTVNSHMVCWGNLKERDHLKYIDIDGRIILKCILKNRMVRHGQA